MSKSKKPLATIRIKAEEVAQQFADIVSLSNEGHNTSCLTKHFDKKYSMTKQMNDKYSEIIKLNNDVKRLLYKSSMLLDDVRGMVGGVRVFPSEVVLENWAQDIYDVYGRFSSLSVVEDYLKRKCGIINNNIAQETLVYVRSIVNVG